MEFFEKNQLTPLSFKILLNITIGAENYNSVDEIEESSPNIQTGKSFR
jgi:hypothetical protein